jgi:crossover junction endodeoxyribonuclease RuvC
MQLYLGVDQSLQRPGLALVAPDGTVVYTAITKVGEKLRGAERLGAIYRFIADTLTSRNGRVLHAAIEGPSFGSVHREFALGEVSGVVRFTIYHLSAVEPLIVAPSQLKLFASGYGAANKDDVLNAVNRQWGTALTDDNEADAVVLAQIARAVHQRIRCQTRAQAEVVHALVTSSPKQRMQRTRRKSTTNI